MCKKLIFLISFVLLLGLVSSASAAEDIDWDDGDPCDHLWSSPLNWSNDQVPYLIDANEGIELGACAYIYTGFGEANSPVIDDSVILADPNTGSRCLTIIVGLWDPGPDEAYLTMTGGELLVTWEIILGLTYKAGSDRGTLNMTGGTIHTLDTLFVGAFGVGTLNMTDPCGTGGGTINIDATLHIPGEIDWLKGIGSGHVNLEAGTITCGSISMGLGDGGTMDINDGVLIIDGDVRGLIAQYAGLGWITGRGSTDPRNVGVAYDDVNNVTIVTYDPEPDVTVPWDPDPYMGATGVYWKPTLSWEPGAYAETHTVYFGSSLSDVNAASATPVSVNQVGTTYTDPNLLEFGQTYYWRIHEVNDPCVWPGAVWFFTVGDYVVVDDFDSYASTDILNDIWHDYVTAGGGVSGQGNAEVILQTITVHDGNSMEYRYNNLVGGGGDKERFSESWADIADLAIGTDWTGSAKALVLYFYGQPGNAPDPVYDRMWVVLSDDTNEGMVKYDGDMNDIKKEEWQQWNINLQDPCLSAVDTNNVTKVYIGFGVRAAQGVDGTNGTVYFDDIRVYPARCVDEFAPAGDITGDCLVDYADVNALAGDWLLSDDIITATEPDSNGLVGWWKLDEGEGLTASDSAGSSNGTLGGPSHDPDWLNNCGDPCHSPCLDFDGVGYVNVPPAAFADINDQITVTLWQYGDTGMTLQENIVLFHACDACEPLDLAVKGEFYNPDLSAEGCEIFFDAGYGGDCETCEADWAAGWAIAENYQGQWNHWAFTKNANTGEMKIYLNGVLFADQDEEEEPMNSPVTGTEIAVFKIGSYYDDTRRYDGYMSDFRLYNYALSYGEVRHVAGQMDDLYIPLPNPEVDLHVDGKVNFKDYIDLANTWLVETFWP